MKKWTIAACVFLAIHSGMNARAGEDNVVARIGNQEVTMADFRRWVGYSNQDTQKSLAAEPKRREMLLRQIVTSKVIADEARKNGFDGRDDVQENMELLVENFLTLEYLNKVIAGKVTVDEKELQDYYEKHKAGFTTPESVRASHILIKAPKTASEEVQAEARARIEDILERVKVGEDFAKLAGEYSEDPGSRKKGGDLGFFGRGTMVPEFEKAAFALEPGQVSDIVRTNYGFHIIRFEEKKEPSVQPFAAVRDKLLQALTVEKKKKAVDAYVAGLVEKAKVEFYYDTFFQSGSDPHAKISMK